LAKHRADKGRRAATSGRNSTSGKHRRRNRLTVVVPATAFVVVAGGGIAVAGVNGAPHDVHLSSAHNSWESTAAVMASRQNLYTSRAGTRVLLGADRIDAIAEQNQKTLQRIKQREAREEARKRAAEARRQAAIEARQWGAPLDSYRLTARFGDTSSLWSSGMHTGLDFANVPGTPVHPVGPGKVTFAGYDGSYGNKIVVQHPDGWETWYCHLEQINVSVGEAVTHDTVIGLLGGTGNVTGPHLHLELRPVGGDPVDPETGLARLHGLHF